MSTPRPLIWRSVSKALSAVAQSPARAGRDARVCTDLAASETTPPGAAKRRERLNERAGLVYVHDHAVTEHAREASHSQSARRLGSVHLHQLDATGDFAGSACQTLCRPLEHRGGRIRDGHLVAVTRQRYRLVPRSTSHVDQACGRWGKVPSQVRVQDVGPHPSPKRAVVAIDERPRQLGPGILTHTFILARRCATRRNT